MDRRIVTKEEALKLLCPVTSGGFMNNCRGPGCMHWQYHNPFPITTDRLSFEVPSMTEPLSIQREKLAKLSEAAEREIEKTTTYGYCTSGMR